MSSATRKGGTRPARPKKRYGQHFLTDKNIIRKIVSAAKVSEGESVLEIGPGRGALTEALVDAGARVLAIEVDEELADGIRERFPADRVEVIRGDALKLSFRELGRELGERHGKLKLVANLPYYISGPVLAKLLDERDAFTVMVLMFQKEVGDRIVSGPGSRDYGILSVLAQAYTDVKKEFDVPARLFFPKPKVDSTVLSFRVLDSPKVPIEDERFFKSIVRAAFGTRRKMLVNSLASTGLQKPDIEAALREAGIDPGRRGETLDLNDFGRLTRALHKRKKAGPGA
ncbi:MAG: 16S rRNA (adenine(1518)-N(6)/adenine(1519)-N(6))-dimethyltransferase RsmA [Deltaproteobacteria bacterium]|nr:16S rRNA (adenine(1518)-N(6)/adenine(1519)-N(6))-dimethyltransferase RsmA [Deltaproteobacteria bacterium]MCL4874471.1 16S rRNA (adenine(1518)-N(6)/adenine(1519)-N(6))-dimethyltransferase RsmA [bacterium]